MKGYKLLTPGPLTTTSGVKKEMLFDRCTWDDEYKNITQKIRGQLLEIAAAAPNAYTAVLMQGSGSFGVEAVLMTCISKEEKCLIIINGAYGERIASMAKCIGTNHVVYRVQYDMIPNANDIKNILENDVGITHIAMVHCETTTGILNPIQDIADISKAYGKTLIVDAMSSFGGIEMNIQDLGIDYLISSANKCIQGVPGFCFVVAKREKLLKCRGNARCLSLDLYEQWKHMDQDGKWRYTSPTHVVAAFSKALDELAEEGGVFARSKRYESNNRLLRGKLKEIGIVSYIKEAFQSPIITTFRFPTEDFDFNTFYHHAKERGFVLYPGKLTDVDTFRIGNIGEIHKQDILQLCNIIEEYVRA
ncbi:MULTISPECIES: 2-aminoethylphosphonate--pyruvate transaminase [Pelosinus]|uniref:2-aminoethylphosphonate--pyruvate transaminase n=1 Tax=Pelosinus fermentans B4 TaxID=1149862 RepID=I8RKI2_9FIRM|nr:MULTISPECIES: 2-aminoethylphosphonate--pyruvate transaminase [Pelosinus]EIW18900.1 2-aminoethylphosphonate/pyruvate transaminase [Pelosinus fermentans B4]EIW21889.1 2-aminoethylphosphonate/pyruvate transaminase [Pelosinus fermentans A11]OAM95260.1 2-aminoethylphosphonate--pyruvate transaminase [Pelosinus fermentans DSM 17108]SDR25519.1 2-aminoethylphosphonate-pyruvate transaminase [Pelosinus fermentans]